MVILADGTKKTVNIGGDAGDPKLVITDLLPHLGAEQNKKPLPEGISGEQLNLLLGSRPVGDEDEGQRVKLGVLQLLNEKYGITEDAPSWAPTATMTVSAPTPPSRPSST